MNQALQLLNSRDESYCFKTGAEVNKVCPCSGKQTPAAISTELNMDDSNLPVSVGVVAHGCSDAPADASTKPHHNPSLLDAA